MAKSTTLTLRLNIQTVVGCGQLAQANGIDTRSQPISTTVREVMEGLIKWMEEQGQLSLPTDEEIMYVYESMFAAEPVGGQPQGMDFTSLGDAIRAEGTPLAGDAKSTMDSILHQAADNVQRKTPYNIGEIAEAVQQVGDQIEPTNADISTTTEPTETTEAVRPPTNVFRMNRMGLSNLLQMAPQDIILIECDRGEQSKEFIAAVEAIYTGLSPASWGTEVAQAAIADLLKWHELDNPKEKEDEPKDNM